MKEFSYQKFSKNDFYEKLNSRLVDMSNIEPGQHVVDLACGTGSVTQLILKRIRGAKDSAVTAIDNSSTSLKQAMEELNDVKDAAIKFIQSHVEPLSELLKDSVDAIFFCNAIHYVSDKNLFFIEVSKTLKPGGEFVFNTSFFEGGQPPETLGFYRKWMLKSRRLLRNKYGLSVNKADSKVESRNHLNPEEYRNLLELHNLRVVKQKIDEVPVPVEGWEDISQFEDFISGTMPGVPLDKASDVLKETVREIYDEMGIEFLTRNWLEVVAVKI
ncbi:MAG: 16S rRNA (cytosine(1402)-N(4))-methyltransferase [Chloroflexi bacterium]|nr:16S rRNA (cytosine(1402)-N(4))-methyltransferase [Chloroflexota bacterium]MCH2304369.1 methyltransferase domain-containing protein [SAR202 cluster bacterium]